MIPEEFIKSNLEGIAFIAPEIILTLAILILLCVGIVLPHRRHRLVFTILAVAGLAGSLFPLWKLPQPTPDLTYLFQALCLGLVDLLFQAILCSGRNFYHSANPD